MLTLGDRKHSWNLVLVLAGVVGWLAPASAQQLFVRGEVTGDSVDIVDSLQLLAFLVDVPATFTSVCTGSAMPLMDAADTNDNEYFTVADYMRLLSFLFVTGVPLAPPNVCGIDPTTSTGGFDATDPAYRVRATNAILEGGQVQFSLRIQSPVTVVGVAIAIARHPNLVPGSLVFEPAYVPSLTQSAALRDVGDTDLLMIFSSTAATVVGATGGMEVDLGTITYSLIDASGGGGMEFVPELDIDGWLYRATIVGPDFADHHPELISDVPGIDVAGAFRRGDLSGNGVYSGNDASALSAILYGTGATPLDCNQEPSADLAVADVNDNEYLGIADILLLSRRIVACPGDVVPSPSATCGTDPDDDTHEFELTESTALVSAFTVSVTGAPTAVRNVDVDVRARTTFPTAGVELVFELGQELTTAATFFTPAGAGAVVFGPQQEGNRVKFSVATLGCGGTLTTGNGTFELIGTIHLLLEPEAIFPPPQWVEEATMNGILTRCSLVDTQMQDHHPYLVSGAYLFARGNANNFDASVDIADAIFTLSYLFQAGSAPTCGDAADANNDGSINIADPIWTLSWLFAGGPIIPGPYPECGYDLDFDALLVCGSAICP